MGTGIGNLHKSHSFYSVAKGLAESCPCLKVLWKEELKVSELGHLVEEISKQMSQGLSAFL